MFLLFPGRHQLLTNFQFRYLFRLIHNGLQDEIDVNEKKLGITERVDGIICPVTSANHSNTRRNPLPFYLRALALQDFSEDLNIPFYIYGIDDVGNRNDFPKYIIKRIRHESDGAFDINPTNTVVICSTPVLELYEQLGFRILSAELTDRKNWTHLDAMPWDIVTRIATSESDWKKDPWVLEKIHPSSFNIWNRYNLGKTARVLFADKMISEDGDITTTRDYNSYVRQMDEIAEMKYKDTASFIKPGRIGDIGCAVGSWIKLACHDERLRESDFYGIEVARHLFDICQQRKHNGEFGNPFVFFSQKNAVTALVFEQNSMNTIFTSSLTHEIESYGSREDLLKFISNRFRELVPGGIWINRDVVGPENKNEIVYLELNKSDGRNDDWEKDYDMREELRDYLKGLSTFGRFLRFARDFRKKEGDGISFEFHDINGRQLIRLTLQHASEFLTKKDYIDNWKSEMHEKFCFWSFEEWKQQMEQAGFKVLSESTSFANPWIVENRFKNTASIWREEDGKLVECEFPVTNMFLYAVKEA